MTPVPKNSKVSFRESSLENGMLPCLARCFMAQFLKSLDLGPGMDGFHGSGLEKVGGWVVWKGGFRDSSPEKQDIHPNKVCFWESSLENGMLPRLARCFHDSSSEKLGSWTWGWMVFMTRVLKGVVVDGLEGWFW